MTTYGRIETGADHFRIRTGAATTDSELGTVKGTITGISDECEDAPSGIGHVCMQPFLEEFCHFARKSEQDVSGGERFRLGSSLHDSLDLAVGKARDDRSDHYRDRHACFPECGYRFKSLERGRSARLHAVCEPVIEGGYRDGHGGQIAVCHVGEDVEIPQDKRGLGDDAHRVAMCGKTFQDAPCDAAFLFHGLVGIRDGTEGDRRAAVARPCKFLTQALGDVVLGKYLRLEILPWRKPEVGMGRSCEAIDASVLASPVGVEGAVKGNIWRLVPGERSAGCIRFYDCGNLRFFFDFSQVLVDGLVCETLEPPASIAESSATFDGTGCGIKPCRGMGGTFFRFVHAKGMR